ncbi:hypothetical protein QLQ80_03115 [Mycoplasma sp. M5725]|uniref:Uncharacterized protein n=1 Tax=Mycoplasma phocimorsus TaxID=3045839 RepID=A0AAJ1PRL5_9MOLU|nr:hypothetical protein [Mycoplasma phocimorsus]MDJ1646054.1 hypothetical protein [Mycoplasma phocimorsus]MDJ1646358.1 hypothetical protein [Mycoplasma phocimorsus]MDJ1648135.1 hypothetical protein [Mycoplasma phocimorsus]MDJ1649162.1 hypothetical protein [Mycoplasma phocimorsus]
MKFKDNLHWLFWSFLIVILLLIIIISIILTIKLDVKVNIKISKENSTLVGFLNNEQRVKITSDLKLMLPYKNDIYKLPIKDFLKIENNIWKYVFETPKDIKIKTNSYINGWFLINEINILNILFKV